MFPVHNDSYDVIRLQYFEVVSLQKRCPTRLIILSRSLKPHSCFSPLLLFYAFSLGIHSSKTVRSKLMSRRRSKQVGPRPTVINLIRIFILNLQATKLFIVTSATKWVWSPSHLDFVLGSRYCIM